MSNVPGQRLSFVDWMKALGILVIVLGHVAARTSDWLTPPIYPKQLGVAFFVFVTGYTLAREQRPAPRVLFNRLFEVYLYGFGLAVLWSLVALFVNGDVAESNYLPFVGGANVLINFFPANPSTWYIGTYLHILLLWAFLLRRVRVRGWMLVCVYVLEVLIRGVLIQRVGGVIPYMLLSNWMSVLLTAIYVGQHAAGEGAGRSAALPAVLMLAFIALWRALVSGLVVGMEFPWMSAAPALGSSGAFAVSGLVSVLYLVVTLLMFECTRSIGVPKIVSFLSRHTLFIFLAHMPLYYVLRPVLVSSGWSYSARSVLLISACLPGLACISELLVRILPPASRRDRLFELALERLRFARGLA